ncbi:MAG: hypothetical protein M3394_09875, partial [Actinomycetota bacterium]|nr:hypothetical protein [Actinomycetota bacterium]
MTRSSSVGYGLRMFALVAALILLLSWLRFNPADERVAAQGPAEASDVGELAEEGPSAIDEVTASEGAQGPSAAPGGAKAAGSGPGTAAGPTAGPR